MLAKKMIRAAFAASAALAVTYFVFIVSLRVNLPVMPMGFQ